MHKNQLQELAQRSCFNLPSYSSIREGPDHAPRFKASVTFNGESYESPGFFNTLRQAEHAAAEVALNKLSKSGPNQSLAARILDETGVCKNLLQETAQRAGVKLPVYSVVRSGPGHMPVFVSTVEFAGMSFSGEAAKTKKQAEKNAAMAAWASIKELVTHSGSSSDSTDTNEEQLQIIAARFLMNNQKEENMLSPQRSSAEATRQPTHSPVGTNGSTAASSQQRSTAETTRPNPKNIRIRITPFPESSERSNQNHTEPGSLHATGLPSSDAATTHHNSYVKSASHSRINTHRAGPSIRAMPVQVHSVPLNPGSDPHTTVFTMTQLPQGGPSTIIIKTDNGESHPVDKAFPLMQTPYNPVLWNPGNQWIGMYPGPQVHHAFKPAPVVRVRQSVPVCSAPPVAKDRQDTETTSSAATREALDKLKL